MVATLPEVSVGVEEAMVVATLEAALVVLEA